MTNAKRIPLLLGLIVATTNVLACSCLQIAGADPVEEVNRTDAVFRARAVTTAMLVASDDGEVFRKGETQPADGFLQRLVVLRVEELFHGDVAPLTILVTGSGGGDCGYAFEDGKEYLVFATLSSEKHLARLAGSPQVLTTSICTFTRAADGATELLTALRKKYPPKKPAWLPRPQ